MLPPKNENFQIKNSDTFRISAHNIHCGYSLIYVWSRNKKNNVYPCKPTQFYYIKVGFKGWGGGQNYISMFSG